MPGPGRKPRGLKIVSGTTRPDRDAIVAVELPPLHQLPPRPDWLPNARAAAEWDRLAPILLANSLLTEAGLVAFATLCAVTGIMIEAWASGETPSSTVIGQYRTLSNDFGLTPAAQGKIRAAGAGEPANRFAANGKRSA